MPDTLPLLTLPQAAAALAAGGLVAMPTETVYGLAADAQNAQAVAQISERLRRRTPTLDIAVGDLFINQVGRADRHFRQKLRAVKQQDQQIKQRRVAMPNLE